VVHSPNQDMNDHYDAVAFWRTTYRKWLSAVQLPASERYPIELVLAGSKCGELFKTIQGLQPIDYIERVEFCHWILGNGQLHTKILFTDAWLRSADT